MLIPPIQLPLQIGREKKLKGNYPDVIPLTAKTMVEALDKAAVLNNKFFEKEIYLFEDGLVLAENRRNWLKDYYNKLSKELYYFYPAFGDSPTAGLIIEGVTGMHCLGDKNEGQWMTSKSFVDRLTSDDIICAMMDILHDQIYIIFDIRDYIKTCTFDTSRMDGVRSSFLRWTTDYWHFDSLQQKVKFITTDRYIFPIWGGTNMLIYDPLLDIIQNEE